MARKFNGTADFIKTTLAGVGLRGGSANHFALSLWVNPTSLTGDQCAFYNGNSAGDGWGIFASQSGNSGNLTIVLGGIKTISTATALSTNKWQNLLLVAHTDNFWYIFVDGVLTVAGDSTAANTPTTNTYIGSDSGPGSFFAGQIADVALWSGHSLQGAGPPFAALRNGLSPLLIEPNTLVGYWPLNESSANEAAIDLSAYRRNVVAQASPAISQHPPILRRTVRSGFRPEWFSQPAAGAAFQAAWAARANPVTGSGIY